MTGKPPSEGLSEANRALVARVIGLGPFDPVGHDEWLIQEAKLNALLDAAREEGRSPVGVGWRFKGDDAELAEHLFQGERDLHAVGEGEPGASYNCALPAYIGEAATRLLAALSASPAPGVGVEEVARAIYASLHHLMRANGTEAQAAYAVAARSILALFARG